MIEVEIPIKKWALFVYFAVDVPEPQMHSSAIRKLVDMTRIGSSSDIYVAVQIDLPGVLTRRYVLPEAGHPVVPPTVSIPNVNSADPRSILDFIQWAAKKCPARNTMIVLWGHGYGLDDYVPPGAHVHIPGEGIDGLSIIVPPSRATTNTKAIPQIGGLPFDYGQILDVIFDAGSKEVSSNSQVGAAVMAAIPSLSGDRKPAILGFASCEMAMVEVWSEFVGCAEFGIASQTPIPYQDWPLDHILKSLLRHPQSDPETVAQMVTDAFIDSFAGDTDDCVAISVVGLSKIEGLVGATKPLAEALVQAVSNPKDIANIFEARNHCPMFDPDGFIDLGCFCQFLKITMPHSPVSIACDSVLEALETFVVSSDCSPRDASKKLSQSTGLSVWFPSWIEMPQVRMQEKGRSVAYLSNGYPSTKFAQATGWDKFLVAIRDSEARRRALQVIGAARS